MLRYPPRRVGTLFRVPIDLWSVLLYVLYPLTPPMLPTVTEFHKLCTYQQHKNGCIVLYEIMETRWKQRKGNIAQTEEYMSMNYDN